MTSAPRSARMVVATGPAMKLAASMTRRPSSNGIAESGSARAAPRRRRALGEKAEREQYHTDGDRRVGDVAVRAEAVRRTRRAVKWLGHHRDVAERSVRRRSASSTTPTVIAESATWAGGQRPVDGRGEPENG